MLIRRLWIAAFVLILMSPLLLLTATPPRGAVALQLFGICVGFVALVAIVLQLLLVSRVRAITTPFGFGRLLRFHRLFGIGILVLVVVHVGAFLIHDPRLFLPWLFPWNEPAKAQLGWAAAVALVLLWLTSMWRRRLHIDYEAWRVTHLLLSIILVGGAATHAVLVAWYSSIPAFRWLGAGVMAAGLLLILYLRIGRAFASLGMPYLLTHVQPERGDAVTLHLEAFGHDGVPFAPGQFAWLRLEGRPYSIREHPFSYSSSAWSPDRPAFTIRNLGDFTSRAGELQPGATVLVDGPHGSWDPPRPDGGFVLIVGGVGVTPAMSVIRTHVEGRHPRPIRLVYAARTIDDVTYREELTGLDAAGVIELLLVLERSPADWAGHRGRIDANLLPHLLPPDALDRNYFLCGPPPMVDAVDRALGELGIPRGLIYADRFETA